MPPETLAASLLDLSVVAAARHAPGDGGDNTGLSRQSRWFHAIVSDLQVVVGAMPFATSAEAIDILRRFADRVPPAANPAQSNNLDAVLRRLLYRLDGHMRPPSHQPPAAVLFDLQPDGPTRDRLRGTLWRLEEHLGPDAGSRNEDSSKGTPALVQRALAILDTQCATPMTLVVLAQRLEVSPSHLSRVLKARTGRSFVHLLHDRRTAIAHRRLTTTLDTVKEAAAAAGYSGVALLRRHYVLRYGETPMQVRRRRG